MNLGVGSIDWRAGDEVVSVTTEHPGCLVPLHNLKNRFGVEVDLIPPPVTPEKIEASLTPRTRLVALSHVDWTNGEVLPLQEIRTRRTIRFRSTGSPAWTITCTSTSRPNYEMV